MADIRELERRYDQYLNDFYEVQKHNAEILRQRGTIFKEIEAQQIELLSGHVPKNLADNPNFQRMQELYKKLDELTFEEYPDSPGYPSASKLQEQAEEAARKSIPNSNSIEHSRAVTHMENSMTRFEEPRYLLLSTKQAGEELYVACKLDSSLDVKGRNDLIREVITSSQPFMAIQKYGNVINALEYARIEQSDTFIQSIAFNFDKGTAEIYEVNHGLGGFADENRIGCNFELQEIKFADMELEAIAEDMMLEASAGMEPVQ